MSCLKKFILLTGALFVNDVFLKAFMILKTVNMKSAVLILTMNLVITYGWAQSQKALQFDTSDPPVVTLSKGSPPPTGQKVPPWMTFPEFPINHNMHITSDGSYYYTINGGNSGTGQINKFDLVGNLIQTYPILIDGRGLSYNKSDSTLYASLFMGDIVKIIDLAAGTFSTVFTGAMHDAQASFAIAPDGSVFYDFANGTLYIHDFATGQVIDTIFGLSYGAGNFGGNAAVAVDSNYIYTWDAGIQTVYIYDLLGAPVTSMYLDSGSNGHSISIANQLLFVARDGNYATGAWFGYGYIPTPPPQAPVASLSCTDSSFCGKQCIDFFDLSTNNPTSWQWLFPGADSTSSNQQNPVGICYSSFGTFDVTLIACNSAGCDTLTIPGLINEYTSPPVPVITFSEDTLVSSQAFSYQWYFNSAPIPGATDQYYVFQQMGTYFVIVTDSNGCASSSASLVLATGINEANDQSVIVYPNPSDGNFMLTRLPVHSEIRIFDITGRIIYADRYAHPEMKLHLKANDGIYFLEIEGINGILRKKIIIKY
jgi:hypothetical protein